MNKICENCDTRCRLGMCKGKEGDFKYCFRKYGSLNGLENTITPFSTFHELYEKCEWLNWIVPDSLVLDNNSYAHNDTMVLLWGQTKQQIGTNKAQPVGYVTVSLANDMCSIEYTEE